MTVTSTLTAKNRTTLPKVVVAALGVKPSDKILYEIENGRVTLRPCKARLADLATMAPLGPKPRRPFSIEEINEAIGAAAAESVMKALKRRRK